MIFKIALPLHNNLNNFDFTYNVIKELNLKTGRQDNWEKLCNKFLFIK